MLNRVAVLGLAKLEIAESDWRSRSALVVVGDTIEKFCHDAEILYFVFYHFICIDIFFCCVSIVQQLDVIVVMVVVTGQWRSVV